MSIIGVACLLRICWAALVPVDPMSDSHAYDVFARNIVNHGVFGWTSAEPFAFWPPGTSFIYAAVYWMFGEKFFNVVVLNIALSCALIFTTFRVAIRFYCETVALGAAIILAVWPTLIMFTTVLASELPFLVLTIGALDAWSSPTRTPLLRGVVAGLLLGAAALVRPFALVLPIVFAGSFYTQSLFRRVTGVEQLRIAVAAAFAVILVIAPWTVRNARLYGEPVLISTNGGITLWMGNSEGDDNSGFKELPGNLKGLNDNEQSKLLGAEAKRYILSDPMGFALRTGKKMLLLYSNETVGVSWNANGIRARFGNGAIPILKRVSQLAWAGILLLAMAGLFRCLLRIGWIALSSPIVSSIAFYTVVHGAIVSQDRYHLAFAPQLAILAGVGIHWILTVSARKWPQRRVA